MGLIKEVRERRLLAYMGAYLVTGFVALEGVDQLISHDILPAFAYPIALVFYVFGMLGSLTFAWYHGEKGRQETTRGEVVIHTSLFVLAMATSAYVFTSQRRAAELAAAAASSGLEASSVAVLYFDDLSSGGELAYVADGITEALIERLSQVRSLYVVSENGVEPYRGTAIPVDSIARVLEVGSIITGSVEQTGDRLRVTTRLVDGFSGADIERSTQEIGAGEFLAARDSVAESVSQLLRQRLGEEVQLRQRQTETASVEAWSLVQRAERLRKTAESQARQGEAERALATQQGADSLLATAELADPGWVRPIESRAHGSFRRAFFRIGVGEFDEAEREIEQGLDHAERALALDPGNASALEQRGVLRYLLWLMEVEPDQERAERLLARARADLEAAVQADERRATAYSTLSHLYSNVQEPVSVILSARRAYEEDAYLSNIDQIMQRLFWAHYDLEQFNDAKRWCDEGAARFADNWQFVECQLWLLLAPSEDPAVDRAWELKARLDSVSPENLAPVEERIGFLLVGGVLRRAGLTDSAESVFQRGRGNEEIDPLEDLVVNEARIRAATGDTEGGMDMLRRYIAANPQHDFIAGGDINWMWRSLRDEPEFQALIRER